MKDIVLYCTLLYIFHGLGLDFAPSGWGERVVKVKERGRHNYWKVGVVSTCNVFASLCLLFLVTGPEASPSSSDPLTHPPPLHTFSMLGYLTVAILGNELIYAPVHYLLHSSRWLYRYHKLHHTLKDPVAIGAAYCHPVEMVVANVSSVGLPLFVAGAPLRMWGVWITIALLTTQHHHSGRRFVWTPRWDHQPEYHTKHHTHSTLHYGNLGLLDRWLK